MDINEQFLQTIDIDSRYEPLLVDLELNGVATVDLLIHQSSNTLGQILKKIGRSVREIEEFMSLINNILNRETSNEPIQNNSEKERIPTGLELLDKELQGGIPVGEITEIFGSSGCGKSQFLYQLAGKSQMKPRDKVVIVNTEKFLETKRLAEIISCGGDPNDQNTINKLENIDYYYCNDLETQDHILYSQLPLKLQNSKGIKTVIIDSIGHHLRQDEIESNITFLKFKINEQNRNPEVNSMDFFRMNNSKQEQQYNTFFKSNKFYELSINKKTYLLGLYRHLKDLSEKYNIAIIVSNQVSDQMNNFDPELYEFSNDPLDLDYQIGGIAGWDNKTIVNYQNQFSSIAHNNESADGEQTNEAIEFSDTISRTLLTDKRRNVDANSTSSSNEENNDSNNNYQLINKIVNSFHQSNGVQTKPHVPSLGYHWTKLVINRILLMKTYKPIVDSTIDYDELYRSQPNGNVSLNSDPLDKDGANNNSGSNLHFTGLDSSNSLNSDYIKSDDCQQTSTTTTNTSRKRRMVDPIPIHSFINNWKAERYLKVVTSTHNYKIKFELSKAGLVQSSV